MRISSRISKLVISIGFALQMLCFIFPYQREGAYFNIIPTRSYYWLFKQALIFGERFLLSFLVFAPLIMIPAVLVIILLPSAVVPDSKKLGWATATAGASVVAHVAAGIALESTAYYGYYIGLAIALALLTWCILSLVAVDKRVVSLPIARESNQKEGPLAGKILGIEGGLKGHAFSAPTGQAILFGRDSGACHIVLTEDAEKVSRKHCSVVFDAANKRYYLTDHSSNGTFLKGGLRLERDKKTTIPSGSLIQLGDARNSFILK